MTTDTPPRYKALLNLDGRSSLLGLNTGKLTEALQLALDTRQQTDGPAIAVTRAPAQLLQQLISAWGNIAKRGFPRVASAEQLNLVLGMSSVHYHLANKKPFEESLQLPPKETTIELSGEDAETQPDIWSQAADVFDDTGPGLNKLSYNMEQQKPAEPPPPKDYSGIYPLLSAQIINQSPGGYCLEWATNAPANMQTGDILALRTNDTLVWSIATIRWIRQNTQSGAQIGIELLAHRAEPCGTQLLRAGKGVTDYLRALCIPEIAAISRPGQLITAKVPFREGSQIMLNIGGTESQAALGRLVKQTSSYSQFEYTLSKGDSRTRTAKATTASPEIQNKPSEADDFGSLWTTL